MPEDVVVLYVDGGCSGNDQRDLTKRKMVAVVTTSDGCVVSERTADGGSNNIAELMAVKDALCWCVEHNVPTVTVRTDSRNNFSWVLGKRVGKSVNDRSAVLRLKAEVAAALSRVALRLEWVPRDENVAGHYIEAKYSL